MSGTYEPFVDEHGTWWVDNGISTDSYSDKASAERARDLYRYVDRFGGPPISDPATAVVLAFVAGQEAERKRAEVQR